MRIIHEKQNAMNSIWTLQGEEREGYRAGGDYITASTITSLCVFSTCFQRTLSMFRFIRLFDLINVPQIGGDSYYHHFIDEETEAQKGVE